MLNVRSIRSKVSICVYVALAGYLVATLSSIFSNAGISNELNHLRIHHLPLSILTEKLHSLLKEQNALYEEAFLLEEPDQAIKGNDISEEIFSLLEEITANTKRHSMEDCTQIADLSYRYYNFARAAYIYLRAARGEEVNQEKIKNLGVMKGQLLWEFEKLARHYTVLVEYDIESSSNLAKRNTAFLISTLIIVLILVIFLANWVANRLLIKPLSKTQDMVKKFSQGGRILEPAKADRGDEIGELTYSFWQLTEDLQKTTVSKNYVDNIIRSMSDSLIVTTSDGTIKTVNQATLKMLDYQEEELLNHPVTIVHGDDIHLQESPVEEAYSLEKTYKKKNGQRIPVNFSAAVMKDEEQNVQNIVYVASDITELKQAQKELQAYAAKLAESNQELQEFAYVASHDLQEPLRKVAAFGDRLKTTYGANLGDKGLDYLSRMLNAATRMQTLINDLLMFSRVTTAAKPFEPVDLETVVQEVLSDLEIKIAETNAEVEIASLPTVMADGLQMRQLFQNLIGNALKFSRQDVPPDIDIRSETCRSQNLPEAIESQSENFACIKVKDNGIGFDQKYADKIFGVFQRLHTRSEYSGSGIGLSICQKIVKRHGGAIRVESKPDHGATFTVIFPV